MYCLKKVKDWAIALAIAIISVIAVTKIAGHNKHKQYTALNLVKYLRIQASHVSTMFFLP